MSEAPVPEARGTSPEGLSPTAARRVFLTLTATRWMPVGFIVGILVLWMLERGLSLSSALSAMAVIGFVVLALELPTSGVADALGRRPVLIAAAVANLASMVALILADSFAGFVVVAALTGVFRALDSGPLEAWYVDAVHRIRPGVDVDQDLSLAGSVVGIIMAIGVSAVLGWLLLLGLLFSIQDLDRTVDSPTGQPVAQIFLDTVGEKGAVVLMVRL